MYVSLSLSFFFFFLFLSFTLASNLFFFLSCYFTNSPILAEEHGAFLSRHVFAQLSHRLYRSGPHRAERTTTHCTSIDSLSLSHRGRIRFLELLGDESSIFRRKSSRRDCTALNFRTTTSSGTTFLSVATFRTRRFHEPHQPQIDEETHATPDYFYTKAGTHTGMTRVLSTARVSATRARQRLHAHSRCIEVALTSNYARSRTHAYTRPRPPVRARAVLRSQPQLVHRCVAGPSRISGVPSGVLYEGKA